MPSSPTAHEPRPMAAVDARDIVTVEDAHGGLTVYLQGQPTHYLLDGEWYRAAAPPGRGAVSGTGDGAKATPA